MIKLFIAGDGGSSMNYSGFVFRFFYVLLLIPLILIAGYSPFLLGLGLLFLSVVMVRTEIMWLGVFLLVSVFTLMNLNKYVENDLYWYSWQYLDNYGASLSEVFGDIRYGVISRASEPVYHLFSYFLSNATGGDYNFWVVLITMFLYLVPLKIISMSISRIGGDRNVFLLVIFTLFFGILFTQTLHLIRQYMACVFLLVGLYYWSRKLYWLGVVWFILSFLTHNSMAVLVGLFVAVAFLTERQRGWGRLKYAALFAVGTALIYLLFFTIFMPGRLTIDDGSVSLFVKVVDVIILISSVYFYMKRPFYGVVGRMYVAYFAFSIFLIFLHSSIFLSLRYYFVLDFFRWLGFYSILHGLSLTGRSEVLVSVVVVFLGALYFYLRLESSPFSFGYESSEYLFSSGKIFLETIEIW